MTDRKHRRPLPPVARVREVFDADPETGRLVVFGNGKLSRGGKPSGSTNERGYVMAYIDGRLVGAHRLVMLCAGIDPAGMDVDHLDGDPSNNNLDNLRLTDATGNGHNQGVYSHSSSGIPGVTHRRRTGRWLVQIGREQNGTCERVHVGSYASAELAAAVSLGVRMALWGHHFQPARHRALTEAASRADRGRAVLLVREAVERLERKGWSPSPGVRPAVIP